MAAFSLLPDQGAGTAILSRFVLGMSLAAVYHVGMKMIAGWHRSGRGLVLGVMIGALTPGSGLQHQFGSVFQEDWQPAMAGAAIATLAGSALVLAFVLLGPFTTPAAPLHPRYALEILRLRPTALATAGYLGHMCESYAMWTWIPLYLLYVVGESKLLGGAFTWPAS